MAGHTFYLPEEIILNNEYQLTEEESKHLIRVLRFKVGGEVNLIDGLGNFAKGQLINDNAKRCILKVIAISSEYGKRGFNLHLAVAPTKNISRLEWFIEKAVEIGVDEITPIICDHSERVKLNVQRLEKIVISAMKQSQKAYKPIINPEISFKELVAKSTDSQKLVAYCGDEPKTHLIKAAKAGINALVFIGPEGDFSSKEIKLAVQHNSELVSLGSSILRTETAALLACVTINVLNEV